MGQREPERFRGLKLSGKNADPSAMYRIEQWIRSMIRLEREGRVEIDRYGRVRLVDTTPDGDDPERLWAESKEETR